jgi:hypothetical protein
MSKNANFMIGKDVAKKVKNYKNVVQNWVEYLAQDENFYVPPKLLNDLKVRK